MIWRLTIVSWAMALFAGLVVYFSDELFVVFSLQAEHGARLLNLSELVATLLAFLGTLGLCLKLLLEYVFLSRT